jgi:DNA-directed RNA polymerase subunit RPC12/RpoP
MTLDDDTIRELLEKAARDEERAEKAKATREGRYYGVNPFEIPSHLRDKREPKGPYAKYGMTKQEYTDMTLAQDWKCAICEKETKLEIDHDHHTQKVRGLLCGRCNRKLGSFENWIKYEVNYLVVLDYLDLLDDDS